MASCPFKIGDRIQLLEYDSTRGGWILSRTYPPATVMEFTSKGFLYVYDKPVNIGRAQWGQQTIGGECFEEGYDWWTLSDIPDPLLKDDDET